MRLWNGLKIGNICYIDNIYYMVIDFLKNEETEFAKLENTQTKEIIQKKCIECKKLAY